jgi:hypothetical protein
VSRTVRRLRAGEAGLLRDLRLRALAERWLRCSATA